MIDRYSRPEMTAIWELKNKYDIWLKVEILAAEAGNKLGYIPNDALDEIRDKAIFDIDRVLEIERETRHDVISFLTNLAENIGPSSKFVHYGLTSSDVVDTSFSVQLTQSTDMIISDLRNFATLLREKALEHQNTIMIGRSHGINAEPTTFGIKLAIWYFETLRNIKRLEAARETINVGKLSGAVGTYSNIDPFVEEYVCEKLGLKIAEAATQVVQRDRHAELATALAITASSFEKFAVEIRHLQRTEVAEVLEPFKKGQKGSSAMPHKQNPIISERVTGLARVIRSNCIPAMENIALWHERDISHSSVERVIFPDSLILMDYIIAKFHRIIDGLVVDKEQMQENLKGTKGLIFSQKLLLALISKGLTRENAYKIVQDNALKSKKDKNEFKDNVLCDKRIDGVISKEEIEKIFDYNPYFKNVDVVFNRLKKA